jgi:hypothetical protein
MQFLFVVLSLLIFQQIIVEHVDLADMRDTNLSNLRWSRRH